MLLFVGCRSIQDGFWPVVDWLTSESVPASELKRYVAMNVEYPPARIVKLTMMMMMPEDSRTRFCQSVFVKVNVDAPGNATAGR